MKMFMPLLSPAAGVLHWVLPEGSLLAAGDLIARLELDNPAAVTRAAPFAGAFPPLGPPVLESEGVDAWFTGALQAAQMVMAGACYLLSHVASEYAITNPEVPLYRSNEDMGIHKLSASVCRSSFHQQ